MRHIAFIGLGFGFIIMGGGLFALSFRKTPKVTSAKPTKSELREEAALAAEANKLRIGAGAIASFGMVLLLIGLS